MHRILLVEDEPHNLSLLLANLRSLLPHCQFDCASCTRHARNLLKEAFFHNRPYFAVVLDLFLPEEPGGEVVFAGRETEPRPILEELRQYAEHSQVIVLTSFKDDPEVEPALEKFYRWLQYRGSRKMEESEIRGHDILVEKKNPRSDLLVAGYIFTQRLRWWTNVQVHARHGLPLPEAIICRDPHHMEAEIAAEMRRIWRLLDRDARRRVCEILEVDETRAENSNAPDMGLSASQEILHQLAREELKEALVTDHFHIHHATRGAHRVSPEHLEAYATALDGAYVLLLAHRGTPPPARRHRLIDVYVAEMHDPRFSEPRPFTWSSPYGQAHMVLPSEPSAPYSAREIAAHECAHLFNHAIGSIKPDWVWFDEAAALLFQLQFVHGEDYMAKALEDDRAHPWMVRHETSVFRTDAGFCGFPGAAFLWFLIAPQPQGCGLGGDFLHGIWRSATAEWERACEVGSIGIQRTVFEVIDAEFTDRAAPCRELFGSDYARRILFPAELFPSLAASPRYRNLTRADRAISLQDARDGKEVSMPAPWSCLFISLYEAGTPDELTVQLSAVNNGDRPPAILSDVCAQLLYCEGDEPSAEPTRLKTSAPDSAATLVGSLSLPRARAEIWCVYLLIANTSADPPQAQQSSLARAKLSLECNWTKS